MMTGRSLLIVVDTHSPTFVESPELLHGASRVVVIDHHRMMVRHIDNAVVFYLEPYASSASEMVTELSQYMGGGSSLSQTEAEALMAGIVLDTKNFVLKTGCVRLKLRRICAGAALTPWKSSACLPATSIAIK